MTSSTNNKPHERRSPFVSGPKNLWTNIFFCFSLVKLVKCIMTADIIFCFFFFVSQLGMGMGINQAENTEKEMNIYL